MNQMLSRLPRLALLLSLGLPLASHAEGGDLRSCRAIADKTARLACYDALPLPGAAAPAAQAAPMPAPTAVAPATAAAQFGLPQPARESEDTLQSQIVGRFEGWRPKQAFTLANGQVWRVSDDSSAYYNLESPRVTIKRGMLGSFYMSIEGVNQTPRVRRER